jgi:NADPH oxidase
MSGRPSSGLDFSDRRDPLDALDAHPDIVLQRAPSSSLQRNKTERRRLQGVMRTTTAVQGQTLPSQTKDTKLMERYHTWLINGGRAKLIFGFYIFLHVLVWTLGFMHYQLKDTSAGIRSLVGLGFPFARTAALVLHFDVIFILFPVCRNFISLLRQTPLNDIIPFDDNIEFHIATAWSIVTFSAVHIIAHMWNLGKLSTIFAAIPGAPSAPVQFLMLNFATGTGITGWIMTAALGTMVFFAVEKRRRRPLGGFEKFWYTHHLFIIFFLGWQFHGMFCMIKPDRGDLCSYNVIGVFWRFWLPGGIVFVFERILREVRSRHITYVSKVIQHPSKVMEVQIKKERTKTRAGQYIFLSCPEVSYWQWHPFTLTSAPEEDYISVHIRVVGDFTTALSKALGCDFDSKDEKTGKQVTGAANPPVNKVLPRVMVDGPFGSASEDFLNYETILLVGAGIGVTPFASILKSIWYRMNNFHHSKPTRLSKVYFVWVIRDFGTAEWFHSLLHAIEEQDTQNRIEISIYLTAKIKEDDINNILVQDVGAERDAITSLRAPTHFGRPNWDRVFTSIADKHADTDIGVFFCGPAVLSKTLHRMSIKYSSARGSRFFYGKENF